MDTRAVLIGMGYREAQPKLWFKPVGYNLYVYKEETKEWLNYFQTVGVEKKLGIWNSSIHTRPEEPFIYFLKDQESVAGRTHTDSNFEFVQLKDVMEL